MGGSSYGGFELPGVDCSTFEIISYPDLLLIKAKAQSSQIRFVHVIVLPAGKTKHNPLRENREPEDA